MKRVLICAAFALSVTVAAWAQQPGGGAQPPAGTRPGAGTGQVQPGTPARPAGQFMRGSIVSVDPTGNTITLKTGDTASAREQQFRVNDATKYFGTDRKALSDGIRFDGLKAGTSVWYQAGAGDNANMLSHLSLYNPSIRAGAGTGGTDRDRDRDDQNRNRDKDK
jgi:hypothetical protein